MSPAVQGDIGEAVHQLDQFFRVEQGCGAAVLHRVRTEIGQGSAIVVPAGTKHNIIRTGAIPMLLNTLAARHPIITTVSRTMRGQRQTLLRSISTGVPRSRSRVEPRGECGPLDRRCGWVMSTDTSCGAFGCVEWCRTLDCMVLGACSSGG